MTIHGVEEAWSRRGSREESQDGLRYTFSASAGYQVEHTYNATEAEILADTRIPQIGDYYANTFAICKNRSVSKVGLVLSIVSCEFNGETGPNGPDDNPLNKPVEWEEGQATSTEPIDSDARGKPIVTANGEQINGMTMDISDSVFTLKKNFATFSSFAMQAYRQSVNSDVVVIGDDVFLAGTGRMKSCTRKRMQFRDISYYEVSATVQFRYPYNTTAARAWWGRSRHEGFYERLGPVVSFSGGGGSGAEATAFATPAGVLTGIFVTSGGSGYTSAPTCSVSIGSGASLSVSVTDGRVTGVSVSSGGTGYKVRIVRAVDTNGEPMTKPVLLQANGFRETNPTNAVWIETEKYLPLPYATLGFN